MKQMWKNLSILILAGGFIAFFLILQLILPEKEISDSERRALKKKPTLSAENIQDGSYMTDFEAYTQDQFPFRDAFRGIKAFSSLGLFLQKEVNHLYVEDDYISKVEYPLHEPMLDHAANLFQKIYNQCLKDTSVSVYSCIVPDKNYFLAEQSGHLSIDYDALSDNFIQKTPFMTYVSINDLLTLEDFYYTDTHWRQERILPIAVRLCEKMGNPLPKPYQDLGAYEVNLLDKPFYGVYSGQLSLPIAPDKIYYLTGPVLDQVTVTSFSTGTGKPSVVYNMDKAAGKDSYELFLSGSEPLLEIENPEAVSDKELIIFRDSFGSSLIPLVVPAYKKITAVDIRYLRSDYLNQFISFNNQDVLFLYSAIVLNNSMSLN